MDNSFNKKYPQKIKPMSFDRKKTIIEPKDNKINSTDLNINNSVSSSIKTYSSDNKTVVIGDSFNLESNKNLILWMSLIVVSAIIIIGIILFLVFFYTPEYQKEQYTTAIDPEDLDIGSYPEYKLNPKIDTTGIKLPTQEAIEKSLLNGSRLNLNMNECNDVNVLWDSKENRCTCRFPFFGPYCVNEFHDSDYVNFGYIEGFNPPVPMNGQVSKSSGNLLYTVESVPEASSLTFSTYNTVDPTSCTSLCNKDFLCKGVSYNLVGDKYYCSFLRDEIEVIGNTDIVVNLENNMGIYLNKGKAQPKFLNKVFAYSGKRPPVYWIKREGVLRELLGNTPIAKDLLSKGLKPSKLSDMTQNTVVEFTWLPERVVNDGNLVGVWSTKPFLSGEYSSLKARGNTSTVYIDPGVFSINGNNFSDYPLNLPKDFIVPDKVYAMYA